MRRIRKRYRVSVLAAIVGALIVPVGYALSTDATPPPSHTQFAARQTTAAIVVAAPLVPRAHAAPRPPSPESESPSVPDAAKLLLVGTSLFGLAAVVRKAR